MDFPPHRRPAACASGISGFSSARAECLFRAVWRFKQSGVAPDSVATPERTIAKRGRTLLKSTLVTGRAPLQLAIFALCIWLSAANQSSGQLSPDQRRARDRYEHGLDQYKIAPDLFEYGGGCSVSAPIAEAPFLIKKSFNSSDYQRLKDELKKVIGSSTGMSANDSEDSPAFSESLPDKPGSKDGDIVEVRMTWDIYKPGKVMDVEIWYKRVIWVQAGTYGPRSVKPEPAGIERFEKLKAAIAKLELPVTVAVTSSTPLGASANPPPTP
jgi:hypothetical protein